MNTRPLLLEFADAEALTRAADTLRDSGRWQTEWLGPLPLDREELTVALQPHSLARAALFGGLLAGIGGFLLQFYAATLAYPMDVAGRPTDSAIAFVPASLEMAVLGSALSIVVAFFLGAKLPRFHHPVFDIAPFTQGDGDHFFLLVHGEEWQHERVLHLLHAQPPLAVHEVDDAPA